MTGATPPPAPTPVHPVPEVEVTAGLVRALLRDQHPDLAGLPLRPAGTGWDNALWRLGDDLVVRLPLRAVSAPLVAHEQRWLPELAARLPVDVPVPVRVGRPGAGFPWSWSVLPWFDGEPAWARPAAERRAWAAALADVLVALHAPAPEDAPANPFRGVPVASRADALRARLERVPPPLRTRVLDAWTALVDAPAWPGPPVWLHGDPHPANLLVADGRLRAVIDFGDVTSGDPASDLATAWLTFDAPGRAAFRDRVDAGYRAAGLPVEAATWRRGEAWALLFALVLVAYPDAHPHLAAIGRHALREVLGDDGTD